ncbi:MAG: hypothetical protein Q9167_001026 [Letrouitia subvulpina]
MSFFSTASVRRLEPLVRHTVDKLTDALQTHKNSGEPVVVSSAYSGFAIDVITDYAFAQSYNLLDDQTFQKSMHSAFSKARSELTSARPLAVRINQGIVALRELQLELRRQVGKIIAQHESGIKPKVESRTTIFHALLESSMPNEEKALNRLGIDGFSLIRAGTETMGSKALSLITFHLLSKPHLLQKLRQELETVFPDPTVIPSCSELEKLPYLTGVIQEGLRLQYGVATRLQRVAPNEALRYKDWVIPPGTSTGMTAVLVHNNPEIFPDPRTFNPDRWVENPRLDKYLLSFSKGSRICVGITLAYEELYLATSGIFRRVDMELYETDHRDVEIKYDNYTPKARLDSKGIRVLVK